MRRGHGSHGFPENRVVEEAEGEGGRNPGGEGKVGDGDGRRDAAEALGVWGDHRQSDG